jgi:hypothetical protein
MEEKVQVTAMVITEAAAAAELVEMEKMVVTTVEQTAA